MPLGKSSKSKCKVLENPGIWITKSNAMRRMAKEKSDELTVVTRQLDSELLEPENL